MVKTYSKGSRRRAKKSAVSSGIDLPELAPVKRREPNGQARRTAGDRDASVAVMKVRCRQVGLQPGAANLREVRGPWFGCSAGRAMAAIVTDHEERAELWDAIQHMRGVQGFYDAVIGAPSRHARGMRLLLAPEALETDADTPPVDDRTDEEKLRDATAARMRLEGWLGYTDKAARSAAMSAVLDDCAPGDAEGMVTALRCVSDGLYGRQMVWRGRG
ncbi:hypothetical protein [Salipiger marinus]|uniref:hypothetical protein n=1 Tax=Salipiger marinus TaxID=555512 RepID=UPI004058E19F